jgi:exodeoxyribonuclease VII large subunit
MLTSTTDNSTLSVSEITIILKDMIENSFDSIAVKGEISNLTRHRSGHKYFTLKDDKAQIKTVMWRSRTFPDSINNGDEVICKGRLSLYMQGGNYQLDCTSIKEVGLGDLYERFLKIKDKLSKEGVFDQSVKKELPSLPKSVAIITSATGAALQDMLTTFSRRAPFIKISVIPTKMQGTTADKDIIASIDTAEELSPDLIILSRGGGSIEDLWCFNSEELAYRIFDCKYPMITGIGHEIDFTIADFVSDMRAPTPTAAAEMASSKTIDDYIGILDYYQDSISSTVVNDLRMFKNKLESTSINTLSQLILNDIRSKDQTIDITSEKIDRAFNDQIKNRSNILNILDSQIEKLNPDSILSSGYSVVYIGDKQVMPKDILLAGDEIEIKRKEQISKAVVR